MPAPVARFACLLPLVTLAALALAGGAPGADPLDSNGGLTPRQAASPEAARIWDVYWLLVAVGAFVFAVVAVPLLVFMIRYRSNGRGREVEGVEGAHAESFRWTPRRSGAVRQRVDAGRGEGLGTGPGGGSPQREGGAGRRARGHAQDPFSLGVRRGSRPWVAFRCGMASGRVPSPAPSVKNKGANRPPLSDRNQPVLLRLPDQPG